ncbi:MAG: NADH-quinone oxidoreductase subunit NuoK [Methanomassiliicoccaceae archaeon]|nr:NADH-quinone oxidoreductase subunit NuoK [Methanomassiliicoccaceae archaeon]
MIPIEVYLVFAAVLFAIGAYGVMVKNNTIVVLMCIELMLNAANINFIVFSAFTSDVLGQVFVIMSISVAAAEVAVGIAILLNAYKVKNTTETEGLASMRW